MVAATVWSIVVWRAARDARLLLLTAVLALMTVRHVLAMFAEGREHGWGRGVAHTDAPELVALVVAVLMLGAVVCLHRHIRSRAGEGRALGVLRDALRDASEPVLIVAAGSGSAGSGGGGGGRVVFANSAMCRLTGYTESELGGMSLAELGALGEESHGFDPGMLGVDPFVAQATIRRRDGVRFRAVWSVSPVRGSGGAITHHLAIVRDVSEQHEIEDRLEHTLHMYDSLLRGVNAIAWEMDLSAWRFTFVSDAAERLLGYPVSDWLAEGFWLDHVHPDDREEAAAQCMAQTKAGRDHSLTYRMIAADGRHVWIEDIVSVVKRDGVAVGLRGVMVDITGRRQSEAEIRRGDARYRALVEATDTGYVMLDAQGRVVEANNEFLRLTGRLSMDDVIGHVVTEWTAPEDIERNAEAVRRSFELGSMRGLELTYLAPDGRRTVIEVSATVHRENDGPGMIIGLCRDITARKHVEAEVRESRDRLDQIAESVEQAFWLTQCEPHRVLYVSPGFEHIWGLPASALYENQLLWVESIHPDDRASVLQRFENYRRDPMACPYEAEYRVVRPDGSVRWVADRAGKLIDEPGQPVRLAGVAVDITDRKRAELATQASEARYRALYENNPLMIFTVAPDGTVLDVNQPGADQLAYARGELVGQSVLQVFDAVSHDAVRRQLDECFAHPDRTHSWQLEKRTRDGRRISVNETARVVEQPGGPVLLIACEDVTERREAFMKLRASEQRLAGMFQRTPLAGILWDTEFKVAEWNPAAERIFGYPVADAIGQHASFLVPPYARAYVDQIWEGLINNRGGFRGSNDNITRDGRIIICEWYNSPLINDDGRVMGVVSLCEDITERRTAERRQATMMMELDHRVKNNLATILAMAEQTISTSANLEDFGRAFVGRLRAMSRMHEMLAGAKWEMVELERMIHSSLEAFMLGSSPSITLRGPGVRLPARFANALNLALHELATNAAKYGALSVATGCVSISWTFEGREGDGVLRVRWVESGGPAVRPPTRRGFGTDLIEGVIAYELGGEVRVAYHPDGVHADLTVPINPLNARAMTPSAAPAPV